MTTRTYGCCAANPKGTPEDPERCIATVMPTGRWVSKQCNRKRGFGKDGLYCKVHARMYK